MGLINSSGKPTTRARTTVTPIHPKSSGNSNSIAEHSFRPYEAPKAAPYVDLYSENEPRAAWEDTPKKKKHAGIFDLEFLTCDLYFCNGDEVHPNTPKTPEEKPTFFSRLKEFFNPGSENASKNAVVPLTPESKPFSLDDGQPKGKTDSSEKPRSILKNKIGSVSPTMSRRPAELAETSLDDELFLLQKLKSRNQNVTPASSSLSSPRGSASKILVSPKQDAELEKLPLTPRSVRFSPKSETKNLEKEINIGFSTKFAEDLPLVTKFNLAKINDRPSSKLVSSLAHMLEEKCEIKFKKARRLAAFSDPRQWPEEFRFAEYKKIGGAAVHNDLKMETEHDENINHRLKKLKGRLCHRIEEHDEGRTCHYDVVMILPTDNHPILRSPVVLILGVSKTEVEPNFARISSS